MKLYYLSWILRKVFADNPLAGFSSPQQSGKGWVAVLTDHTNGQEYLCTFIPIESTKVVAPESADQLLKMNDN